MTPDQVFHGSMTALPTPFCGGAVDHLALLDLIERQIAGGTAGLVVGGTTGEAAALSVEERTALFAYVAGAVRGRVAVVAGVGSSDTRVSCTLSRAARAAGCDGLLASTPAYNRPSQEGLRRHFAAIAETTRLPIALYNIPGRTGVDLTPATAAELAARHTNVVAIKEASGSLERVRDLIELQTLGVLCGDDDRIVDCMQLGAVGVIGVVSNLAPRRVADLVEALSPGGDPSSAPALVEPLAPLIACLSLEANPAPLKAALEVLGLCGGELRLPLAPVAARHAESIRAALAAASIE